MSEPIRVAQILNRMDSGGIEAVVMNYYRHIDHAKVQFDFYFAADSSFSQRAELEELGAGIYPIPAYSRIFAYHNALYRAFKQKQYHIVHAHLSTMSVFPLFAAWRAGVPVRICHNHSTAHWREGKKTLLKYILRPFNKVFATDYFACGEQAGRWMYGNRCLAKGKVYVMPNAIETERFAYDPEARARLRDELGIPQDAFVVGHVGRFMYQKNHKFLVEVFAELGKVCPNARLLLIGEGELRQMVENQVIALGISNSVIFTGPRQDVNKLYSVMDVFCLPSFYEGMPVVAWEAKANGLPSILSDCITMEAICGEGSVQVNLHTSAREWADQLLHKNRKYTTVGNIPDVFSCAAAQEKWYSEAHEKFKYAL